MHVKLLGDGKSSTRLFRTRNAQTESEVANAAAVNQMRESEAASLVTKGVARLASRSFV